MVWRATGAGLAAAGLCFIQAQPVNDTAISRAKIGNSFFMVGGGCMKRIWKLRGLYVLLPVAQPKFQFARWQIELLLRHFRILFRFDIILQ
jgi:hypothetical protein